MDPFRRPVEGASVSIVNSGFVTTTGPDGRFELDYAPGSFQVRVRAPGFLEDEIPLQISQHVRYPLGQRILLRLPEGPAEDVVAILADRFYTLPTVTLEVRRRITNASLGAWCQERHATSSDIPTLRGHSLTVFVPDLAEDPATQRALWLVRAVGTRISSDTNSMIFQCPGLSPRIAYRFRRTPDRRLVVATLEDGLYCFIVSATIGLTTASAPTARCFHWSHNPSPQADMVLVSGSPVAPPVPPPTPRAETPPPPAPQTPPPEPPPSDEDELTGQYQPPSSITASSYLTQGRHRYNPELAFDDNPRTAWNEGAPGNGEGEWLEAYFASPVEVRSVTLHTGWDAVTRRGQDLFVSNAHVRRVTLLLDGREHASATAEEGQRSLTFDRVRVRASRVRLRFDAVWPGTRFPDLAISEVEIAAR